MLDVYRYGSTSRISPEAPVPVVKVSRESIAAGGAANVAVNLQKLGCFVELLGYIGEDNNGRQLRAELQQHGIIHTNLVESFSHTISKTRIIVDDQYTLRCDDDSTMRTRIHRKHHEGELVRALSELGDKQRFDIVIVSDYAKGTITDTIMDTIKASFPCKILCDIKPTNAHLFNDVFCVVPNLQEALELVNAQNNYTYSTLAREIKNRFGLQAVVITLSEHGIFLLDQHDNTYSFEAHVVDYNQRNAVLDVTGAGDTVISALAACLAIGYDLKESVRLSNLAAGVVVGKTGTAVCSAKELQNENLRM